MDRPASRYALCIVACLTLGLAPFSPEPHLVEKVRWVSEGAQGMRPIDWFDLVLHSAPWLALLGMSVYDIARLLRR
jgi:hypothetical protein